MIILVIIEVTPVYKTGTRILCQNWLDEGVEINQDQLRDTSNPAPLTFTWEKKTRGRDATYVRLGETQGRGNKTVTKDLFLEPGEPTEGYLVDIRIKVTDQYGGTTTELLSLMVIKHIKL